MGKKQVNNRNKKASVRKVLAVATSSLLVTPVHAGEDGGSPWEMDSSILYYGELDRVHVIKPVLSARKEIGEERFLTVRTILDTMSGASPNGAAPSSRPQTFTTSSGRSSYTVAANKYPMRDFSDNRVAGSVALETPLNRLLKAVLGLNGSVESDYLSLGGSATLLKDINDRLTTLSGGIAVNYDLVRPSSQIPEGLAVMGGDAGAASMRAASDDDDEEEEGDDDGRRKVVMDLLLGVTQVINRRTISRLNYGFGISNGYLTDPYKIVSRVDARSGLPVDYLYEKRPDNRIRNSLYWHIAHQFDEDSIHLSYRYFWDDWGIQSHTIDLKYRFEMANGHYLQPHLRYYTQTAADFYHHSLVSGQPLPRYASADLRLAEFVSATYGIKYGMPLGEGELRMRVEYMRQNGESHPNDAIGDQKNQDLFPTLEATIFQMSYSFVF